MKTYQFFTSETLNSLIFRDQFQESMHISLKSFVVVQPSIDFTFEHTEHYVFQMTSC